MAGAGEYQRWSREARIVRMSRCGCARHESGTGSLTDLLPTAGVRTQPQPGHLRSKQIHSGPRSPVSNVPRWHDARCMNQEVGLLLFVWIVLGLIVGLVFSKVTDLSGDDDFLIDIVIGIAGAMSGGWLYEVALGPDAASPSAYSLAAAVAAASVFLLLYHAVISRTR